MAARPIRHFLLRIARKFAERVMHRAPDFIVGGHDNPYLQRWYVLGAKPHPTEPRMTPRTLFGLCRIYVHRFDRSDDDRAHHDHPAASLSLALWGKAVEHTIAAGGVHHRRELRAGQWRFRRATFAHRIEIAPGEHFWTLFIFFRNSREWGFHCPRGWVHWKKFVASNDPGEIGAGCGDTVTVSKPLSEQRTAQDDMRDFGIGFTVDGKRVAPERVCVYADSKKSAAYEVAAHG